MEASIKFNLKEVKLDLLQAIKEYSQRGLLHTTKWYVNFCLKTYIAYISLIYINVFIYLDFHIYV